MLCAGDAATRAIEPWYWTWLKLLVAVLWFMRRWYQNLTERRLYQFKDPITHAQFNCCTWRLSIAIPNPTLRAIAVSYARENLLAKGYELVSFFE